MHKWMLDGCMHGWRLDGNSGQWPPPQQRQSMEYVCSQAEKFVYVPFSCSEDACRPLMLFPNPHYHYAEGRCGASRRQQGQLDRPVSCSTQMPIALLVPHIPLPHSQGSAGTAASPARLPHSCSFSIFLLQGLPGPKGEKVSGGGCSPDSVC